MFLIIPGALRIMDREARCFHGALCAAVFDHESDADDAVAQVAEKTGRISNYHAFEARPHLRRNNRIRSIHSSLAIEANSLSLDEVRSVISGKTVVGPQKEIQEVKKRLSSLRDAGGALTHTISTT